MSENLKYNYVLFHNPCFDGFLSFVLLRETNLLVKDNLYIRGTSPDIKKCPPKIKNKNIIIIDLNLDKKILLEILKEADNVLYIDHHRNNHTNIKHPKFKCIHDEKKCASILVWENFLKKGKKKMPELIKYIDDGDRMANLYEETSLFTAAFEVHYNEEQYGLTPEGFNKKADTWLPLLKDNKKVKNLIKIGKHYYLYKYVVTKKSLNNFETVQMKTPFNKTWKLIVTNIGGFCAKLVASQLQQFDSADCCIVWYYHVGDKAIRCTIRSKRNNVVWLAKKYGGGGHPHAASFTYKSTNIYDWLEKHNKSYK